MKEGSWHEVFSSSMAQAARRLGWPWRCFQQITGINAVLYYGSIIVKDPFFRGSRRGIWRLAANVNHRRGEFDSSRWSP